MMHGRKNIKFISVGSVVFQLYPVFWVSHTTVFLYVFCR